MNRYTRRTLAAYLASATISLSPGIDASMLPQMEAFPLDLVEDMLEEVADEDTPAEEKIRTLATIATDKRAEVRVRICEILASILEEDDIEMVRPILEQLAVDPDPAVRAELHRSVASAMMHTSVVNRTRMAADLALSDSEPLRLMLISALKEDFFCLGVTSVVAHLAEDGNPRIRRAVVEVSSVRMSENPVYFQRILNSLLADRNATVRLAAKRALRTLRSRNYSWIT
jgi:hypothetical protein